MPEFEPMDVVDVHHERGISPYPPLDSSWSNQQKLVWHASLVEHRTGIRCRIHNDSKLISDGQEVADHYGIHVGSRGTAMSYESAWIYLNGVESGAQAAQLAATRQ